MYLEGDLFSPSSDYAMAFAENALHAANNNKTGLKFEKQANRRAKKPQLNRNSYLEFYEQEKNEE